MPGRWPPPCDHPIADSRKDTGQNQNQARSNPSKIKRHSGDVTGQRKGFVSGVSAFLKFHDIRNDRSIVCPKLKTACIPGQLLSLVGRISPNHCDLSCRNTYAVAFLSESDLRGPGVCLQRSKVPLSLLMAQLPGNEPGGSHREQPTQTSQPYDLPEPHRN